MTSLALHDTVPEPQHSRRASIRYRCDRAPARRVFLLESYQTGSAEIQDLSAGGIGFIFDRPIPSGALLFIDLLGMEVPVEFLAHVVHSTARPQGDWLIGCRFDRPLTQEEMHLILGQPSI